uniref:Uncharacterized protein n=1 Tax=Hyaloperonospora arabidopsidis (strain Emoy2) TaxID=559515 RepID=M4BJP4_HYAAE
MSIVGVHYAVDGPKLFRTDLARLGRSLRSICARHLVAKDTEEGIRLVEVQVSYPLLVCRIDEEKKLLLSQESAI